MAVVHREVQRIPVMPTPTIEYQPRGGQARSLSGRALSAFSWVIAVLLALWLAYTLIGDALAVGQQKLDDLRYGYPRSFQADADLGGRPGLLPTHFIALNLHGQISVLIVDANDARHVRVLRGPTLYGDGQDLVPPTLRLLDVNHDGHPDLLVKVNDQEMLYLNVPGTHAFRFVRALPASGVGAVAASR